MKLKIKKQIVCLTGMLVFCFCACGKKTDIYLETYEDVDTENIEEISGLSEQEKSQTEEGLLKQSDCYVYICGAVANPGVYTLPEGSRIYEVIELAGGLTEEAEATLLNQAERVTDGMMLRVYTKAEAEELSPLQSGNGNEADSDTRININTAGASELMSLPGVGSAKAEAILSYRDANGTFSSVEELMNVPGIKEGVFEQIKAYIRVN